VKTGNVITYSFRGCMTHSDGIVPQARIGTTAGRVDSKWWVW